MLSQSPVNNLPFPTLGFAARSGTGKTTLLKKIIPLLKKSHYQLGLIKHTHHRITFDNRGMTKRIFEQGTDVIAKSPDLSIAEWHQEKPETALEDGIETYRHLPIDLLLIEGFKHAAFPKIELHRQELNKPFLYEHDAHIIAVASDNPQALNHLPLPVLDINNTQSIADWVENNIIKNHKDNNKQTT